MDRWKFYEKNLNKFINKKSSILIIGGSEREYELFKSLQFENFTVSNFNPDSKKYSYKIIHVDATKIEFKDSSFDTLSIWQLYFYAGLTTLSSLLTIFAIFMICKTSKLLSVNNCSINLKMRAMVLHSVLLVV
jgi:phage pi2 protein 07